MKTGLLTLHKLNLVHLDIKPLNILYSQKYKRWIFIDFGISEPI
jgi:serine/threonine protein kinase